MDILIDRIIDCVHKIAEFLGLAGPDDEDWYDDYGAEEDEQ